MEDKKSFLENSDSKQIATSSKSTSFTSQFEEMNSLVQGESITSVISDTLDKEIQYSSPNIQSINSQQMINSVEVIDTQTESMAMNEFESLSNSDDTSSCSTQSKLLRYKNKERFKKANPISPHKTEKAQQNQENKKLFTIQIKESKQTITEAHLDRALKDILGTQTTNSVISQTSVKKSANFETKLTLSIKIHQDQCSDSANQHCKKDQNSNMDETDSQREVLGEIALQSIDLNVATCSQTKRPISLITKLAFSEDSPKPISTAPLVLIKGHSKNKLEVQSKSAVTAPNKLQETFSSISSLISSISAMTSVPNQPPSLFLQALTLLRDRTEIREELNRILRSKMELKHFEKPISSKNVRTRTPSELSPPESLTSAPPSYSFVLRQSAITARPRLLSTFMPSPSFVQRTPPPTYAAAFDLFSEMPVTAQPTGRVYNYGFSEMPVCCPSCGYTGLTVVISKITMYTHLCSFLLCLFCCWVCAPLPYLMRSCQDVYHYCRNCRNLLGMYRPTNPGTTCTVSVPR